MGGNNVSEKPDKKRFSVSLTNAYVLALDQLVEIGIYMEQQDAIRHALRRLFIFYGLDPFTGPEQPEGPR